ncbi:hypothetical protein AB4Z34_09340 [Ensifer sp. 2YAB10]|uniref:hypothetical protein n=1 Tax=unclassified Ensifer TaxID=2633371 RepID=UPI003F8E2198
MSFVPPTHVPAINVKTLGFPRAQRTLAGNVEQPPKDKMSAALAIVSSPACEYDTATVTGALDTVSYFPFGRRIEHVDAG